MWKRALTGLIFSVNLNRPIERRLHISPETSSRVDDSLVVTERGQVLKVKTHGQDSWTTNPVNLLPFRPGIGALLPWHRVGIYRYTHTGVN